MGDELFFANGASVFLAFETPAQRNRFHTALRQLQPPSLAPFLGATAEERWKNDASYERWQKGELSNFEYLLRVNRLAGRRWGAL